MKVEQVYIFKKHWEITPHHEFIVAQSRSDAEVVVHKLSGNYELMAVVAREVFTQNEAEYRRRYRSRS